jgi:hypothetical protein
MLYTDELFREIFDYLKQYSFYLKGRNLSYSDIVSGNEIGEDEDHHPIYGIKVTTNSSTVLSSVSFSNNGSGRVRCTYSSHGLITGDYVYITGAIYTGEWEVTKITNNTFDLNLSSYTTSGSGTVTKIYGVGTRVTITDSNYYDGSWTVTAIDSTSFFYLDECYFTKVTTGVINKEFSPVEDSDLEVDGSDLDDKSRITAIDVKEKTELLFDKTIDQFAHSSNDYARVKNLLVDWYSSLKTIGTQQRNITDVYSHTDEYISELILSFGFNYVPEYLTLDEKIELFLSLVELYEIKGTPESIDRLMRGFGTYVTIHEYWLEKHSYINTLRFRGYDITQDSKQAGGVVYDYDTVVDKDPSWFYRTPDDILQLLEDNKISLPLKTRYFSINPGSYIEKLKIIAMLLQTKLQIDYQWYLDNSYTMPPEPIAPIDKRISMPIFGSDYKSTFFELYLGFCYLFKTTIEPEYGPLNQNPSGTLISYNGPLTSYQPDQPVAGEYDVYESIYDLYTGMIAHERDVLAFNENTTDYILKGVIFSDNDSGVVNCYYQNHDLANGDTIHISYSYNYYGDWTITKIDDDNFELDTSTFIVPLEGRPDPETGTLTCYVPFTNNGSDSYRGTKHNHGLQNGDIIKVECADSTSASGLWTVTRIGVDTFDLDGSVYDSDAEGFVSPPSYRDRRKKRLELISDTFTIPLATPNIYENIESIFSATYFDLRTKIDEYESDDILQYICSKLNDFILGFIVYDLNLTILDLEYQNIFYYIFGFESLLDENLLGAINFFKPYRAKLIDLKEIVSFDAIGDTVRIDDRLGSISFIFTEIDFPSADSRPCCAMDLLLDEVGDTTECWDSTTYHSYDPRVTYDCDGYYDRGIVWDDVEITVGIYLNLYDRLDTVINLPVTSRCDIFAAPPEDIQYYFENEPLATYDSTASESYLLQESGFVNFDEGFNDFDELIGVAFTNNGSGGVRCTYVNHAFTTGNRVFITETIDEYYGEWEIIKITDNTFDLVDSEYVSNTTGIVTKEAEFDLYTGGWDVVQIYVTNS